MERSEDAGDWQLYLAQRRTHLLKIHAVPDSERSVAGSLDLIA
ncbi:MAG: hypothetical protein ACK561_02285 [Pseudomonadaceae bacterium]